MTPYWAEFDLRAAGGVRRVLMQRRRNDPASVWRDIATFDSYNDAEHVLRLLQGRIGDAGAPSVPGDESGNPDAPVEDRTQDRRTVGGYTSSRPATDLTPPPAGPAPGARRKGRP